MFQPKACQRFQLVASTTGSVFLLDGGTGEELFARGVPDDRILWSATAVVNAEHHETLKQVHRSFLSAGAQAITTNSYGIVPGVGFSDQEIVQHCATAGRLAREAVGQDRSSSSTTAADALVLGSMGPLIESYRPDKILDWQRGFHFYSKMVTALAPYVDAFLAETLSTTQEAMQIVEAVATTSSRHPLLISFTVNAAGNLRSDETVVTALPHLLNFCEQRQVKLLAFLFNCSEPEAITKSLNAIQVNTDLCIRLHTNGVLLGAYANGLTPVPSDWTLAGSDVPQPIRADLSPERYYTDFAATWVNEFDVKIIGGCCAITPNHIAYLKQHLQTLPLNK